MLLCITLHSLPCVGTKVFSSVLCFGRQVQTAARIKKLQERRAKLTPAELALHTRCHPLVFPPVCAREAPALPQALPSRWRSWLVHLCPALGLLAPPPGAKCSACHRLSAVG